MNLKLNDPRTNWKFIAIVAVFAILVSGGTIWFTQSSKLTPAPTQTISTPKTPIPQEQIDTSTWQTYRNEEFGFEFQYPSGWQDANILDLLKLPDYYPPAWKAFKSPHAQLDKNKKLIAGSFVFIQISDLGISLENLESQIRSSPGFIDAERTRISGLEAIKAFGQSETKGTKHISLTIKMDQRKALLISCNSTPDDKLSYGICDQILSTFRFVE